MKKSIAIVGLLACSPLWAAEGLSYNYVQLDWIASSDTEQDGTINGTPFEADGDGDGFAIEGVFSFTDTWFVKGSFADVDLDTDITVQGLGTASGSQDGQSIVVGVGGHTNAYTGGVDLVGVLNYVDLESGGAEDDGFGFELGARTLLMPNLEGYVGYNYASLSDGDADGFEIGGVYALTPNWAIGAEYSVGSAEFEDGGVEFDSDTDNLILSGRYNF